jgi:RimJ/RimL family protein N-acetyltransferase
MNDETVEQQHAIRLRPFQRQYASLVVQWVRTPQELCLLAPGTEPPLTAAKVNAWKKAGGQALLLTRDGDAEPIGYAELNPMRRDPSHLWLGHVILCPQERGKGLGKVFVRAMVSHAFDRMSAERIILIVFPDNLPAIKCYRSTGFVQVSEEYHQFNGKGPEHRLLRFEITPTLA